MTEEANHTPGPWRLRADPFPDGTPYFRFAALDGFYNDEGQGFDLTGIMSEADAHLIAAAPDMAIRLEAQERLIETLTHTLDTLVAAASDGAFESEWLDRALSVARAALAQARKEQP